MTKKIPEIYIKKLPYCHQCEKKLNIICENKNCYIRKQCGFTKLHDLISYYDNGSSELTKGDDYDM